MRALVLPIPICSQMGGCAAKAPRRFFKAVRTLPCETSGLSLHSLRDKPQGLIRYVVLDVIILLMITRERRDSNSQNRRVHGYGNNSERTTIMDFRAQDWSGCSASHAGLAFRGLGLEFLSSSGKNLFQWLSNIGLTA